MAAEPSLRRRRIIASMVGYVGEPRFDPSRTSIKQKPGPTRSS